MIKKSYLLSVLMSVAALQATQAVSFKSAEKNVSEKRYKETSWGEDITDHYMLWILSPSISSLLYVINMMYDIIPDDRADYIIQMTILSCVCYGLLAFVLACLPKFWQEKDNTKGVIRSFGRRFWRGIRFLGLTGLLPSIMTNLTMKEYLNKGLPFSSELINLFLFLWVYPCLTAAGIAVSVMTYSSLTQKKASLQEKKPQKTPAKFSLSPLWIW